MHTIAQYKSLERASCFYHKLSSCPCLLGTRRLCSSDFQQHRQPVPPASWGPKQEHSSLCKDFFVLIYSTSCLEVACCLLHTLVAAPTTAEASLRLSLMSSEEIFAASRQTTYVYLKSGHPHWSLCPFRTSVLEESE